MIRTSTAWIRTTSPCINIDDETPGFFITPLTGLTTTESGGTATFTGRPDGRPAGHRHGGSLELAWHRGQGGAYHAGVFGFELPFATDGDRDRPRRQRRRRSTDVPDRDGAGQKRRHRLRRSQPAGRAGGQRRRRQRRRHHHARSRPFDQREGALEHLHGSAQHCADRRREHRPDEHQHQRGDGVSPHG